MNTDDFHTNYADELAGIPTPAPLTKFQMWEIERQRLVAQRDEAQRNFRSLLNTLAAILAKTGPQTVDAMDCAFSPLNPTIKTTEHPDGTITVSLLT